MESLARLNEENRRQGDAGERAEKEWFQRYVEDGGAKIDEPIGQDGCDAKEDHEPQEIVCVGFNLERDDSLSL